MSEPRFEIRYREIRRKTAYVTQAGTDNWLQITVKKAEQMLRSGVARLVEHDE